MLFDKLARAIGVTLCAAAFAASALAQDTIKVGLLVSYSGPTPMNGSSADNIIKQFEKKYGNAPGGKKIEYVRRDTSGPNPEVTRRFAQELITREKVQVIIGPDYTPNVLAVAPLVTEAKVPAIINAAATQGIVGEKSPYYLRTFFAIPQSVRPMAQWAFKNNLKKVVVLVADYGPGHDAEATFTKSFTDLGGTIPTVIKVPVRNPEFSGYMQRIKDANADGVFVFLPIGELCLQFLKAYSDSGLKNSPLKLMATADLTDESTLDAAGDAALGVISSGFYSPTHDTPLNKQFVADHLSQFGKSPRISLLHVTMWDALQMLYSGLEAQKGAKFDPDKFMAHLKGRAFESPRGPISTDKTSGDIVQNAYIRRVERQGGMLQNVEFETFKDVAPK
jgi:branched-chain amino acid transport system substrate-binding protein